MRRSGHRGHHRIAKGLTTKTAAAKLKASFEEDEIVAEALRMEGYEFSDDEEERIKQQQQQVQSPQSSSSPTSSASQPTATQHSALTGPAALSSPVTLMSPFCRVVLVYVALPACVALSLVSVGVALAVLAVCGCFVALEVGRTWARHAEIAGRVRRAVASLVRRSTGLGPVAGMRALLRNRFYDLSAAIRDGKVVMIPSCLLVAGDMLLAPRTFDRLAVAHLTKRRHDEPTLVTAARTALEERPVQLPPLELVPPQMRSELESESSSSDDDDDEDDDGLGATSTIPHDVPAGNRALLEYRDDESSSSSGDEDDDGGGADAAAGAAGGGSGKGPRLTAAQRARAAARARRKRQEELQRRQAEAQAVPQQAQQQQPQQQQQQPSGGVEEETSSDDEQDMPRSFFSPLDPPLPQEKVEFFVLVVLLIAAGALGALLLVLRALEVAAWASLERLRRDIFEVALCVLGFVPLVAGIVGRVAGAWFNARLAVYAKLASRNADKILEERLHEEELHDHVDPAKVWRHLRHALLPQLATAGAPANSPASAAPRQDGGESAPTSPASPEQQQQQQQPNVAVATAAAATSSMCFSRSLVHALSSVTVVASLDSDSVLTESTVVPLRVAFPVVVQPQQQGGRDATEALSEHLAQSFSFVADENLRREMAKAAAVAAAGKKSNRHRGGGGSGGGAQTNSGGAKRRGAGSSIRLKHLELHGGGLAAEGRARNSCGNVSVVSFLDQEEVRACESSVHPIAMCALLHSVHSAQLAPRNSLRHSGDVALVQALDQTIVWARSMHWLARALHFDDRNACRYRLLRRVVAIKRRGPTLLQHKCALVLEAVGAGPAADLHVYCIGSFDAVLGSCTTSWDGAGMAPLSLRDVEHARRLHWPKRLTAIAASHKLLPARYRKWLTPKHHHHHSQTKHDGGEHAPLEFAEDFVVDSELIFSSSPPRHAVGEGALYAAHAPRSRTPEPRAPDGGEHSILDMIRRANEAHFERQEREQQQQHEAQQELLLMQRHSPLQQHIDDSESGGVVAVLRSPLSANTADYATAAAVAGTGLHSPTSAAIAPAHPSLDAAVFLPPADSVSQMLPARTLGGCSGGSDGSGGGSSGAAEEAMLLEEERVADEQNFYAQRQQHRRSASYSRTSSGATGFLTAPTPASPSSLRGGKRGSTAATQQQRPQAAAASAASASAAAAQHSGRLAAMPSSPEAVIASVLDEHTLLGLVGLGSVMHPEVDTYISTLNDAGVRVVHFSDAPLREAKSYAAHVGLSVGEINSCVSLSESEQRRGLGFEYKRAMLPRGIREIRNHLRFFDTVPLQVPLYCDATPSATRAMLSIMQDNHEVVCAFGSARTANIRSVVQASVAVTVEPDPAEDMSLCSDDVMNRINEEPLAAVSTTGQRCHEQMTRLSNSLAAMPGITARFGVPMLALLIREARVTAARLAAATEFAVQASCAIALFRCSTLVGGFQEGLDRGATLFALYVVVPLLTVGVLLAQHPAANSVVGQLKKMPSKHNFTQRIEMLRGWALWFALRYSFTIIMLFAVHLVDFYDDRSLLREALASNASMLATEALELQKRSSHAVALVVCTVFLAAHALCHTSTYATLSLLPAAGRISLFQCRFTLLCGAAAVLLSVAVFHADGLNFGPFAITAVCVYTPLILLLDVLIKRRRLNRMQQRQKYLKLVFSTRLGMHSPVGQLEEVAPEITANKPCASRMGKWASLLFWATCLDGHGDGELQCECCSRPLDRT